MHIKPLFFSLLLMTVFLYSCQEDPTSLGTDLIDNPIQLVLLDSSTDSLNQRSDSYKADTLESFGNATRVLLGKKDDITASMLLRFGIILTDSIAGALEEGDLRVNSASIKLINNYTFGDKNAPYDFGTFNITSDWGSTGFNADSLNMLSYDPADVSANKTFTDSSITFDIESSIAFSWMKSIVDSNEADNFGLLFKPSTGTEKVLGFRAYTGIIFEDSPELEIIVEHSGNIIDTLTANPVFDVHVLEGELAQPLNDRILLQSGLGGRGELYFDLSDLPENANINNAELTLSIDTLNTVWGSDQADSIRVKMYSDPASRVLNKDIRVTRLRRIEDVFVGDISNIIQQVVLGAENKGFDLRLDNETIGLDIVYLFGSGYTDFTLRPKLVIYYSKVDL